MKITGQRRASYERDPEQLKYHPETELVLITFNLKIMNVTRSILMRPRLKARFILSRYKATERIKSSYN